MRPPSQSATRRFILPDPDDQACGAGEDLPIQLFARVTLVRDAANALVPQPIVLETARARGEGERLDAYLARLRPILARAQGYEGEIVDAHDRGGGALRALALRRGREWVDLLHDIASFEEETRAMRAPLGVGLETGATLAAHEQQLLAPPEQPFPLQELPPGVVPFVPRPLSPQEVARRAHRMEDLERAVMGFDVPALLARARVAQPLATQPPVAQPLATQPPATQPVATQPVATQASEPAAKSVDVDRRVAPLAPAVHVPVPHGDARDVRTHAQTAAELLAVRREQALLELQRQTGIGGLFARRSLRTAFDTYVAEVGVHTHALAGDAQRSFVQDEGQRLLASFNQPVAGSSPFEHAIHHAGAWWRRAPLLGRVGIGAACAAAGMAGGLTAALGGGIALGLRSLGCYAAVDAAWQRAELAWVRRGASREMDRRAEGGLAWRMSMLMPRPTERDIALAEGVTRRVRESLSTNADLREILDGAASQARRRPLHALGKAALVAGSMAVFSSETVRGLVSRVRGDVLRVIGMPGAPHVPGLAPGNTPVHTPVHTPPAAIAALSSNMLHLTTEPSPGPDGLERLLRVPVLSEMERHGVALERMSRLDHARALNATANLAQRLHVSAPLSPGDVVNVPGVLVTSTVEQSLARQALPGVMPYVDRVSWPRWIARARGV